MIPRSTFHEMAVMSSCVALPWTVSSQKKRKIHRMFASVIYIFVMDWGASRGLDKGGSTVRIVKTLHPVVVTPSVIEAVEPGLVSG